jgi:hypothetical protein
MRISETAIHDVVSVEVFDVPLIHDFSGKLTATKDIHIKTRDGSEIVLFCYMGALCDQVDSASTRSENAQ